MRPMDHAEAHERLADLALEPGRLAQLDRPEIAEDLALRAHVDLCARCQSELAEWNDVQATVREAVATNRPEQLEPIVPPDDLRPRVLAAARSEPKAAQSAARNSEVKVVSLPVHQNRGLSGSALLALAASLALVAVGMGIWVVRDQSTQLDRSRLEAIWLTDTVSALSRVLSAPEHHTITLRGGDGTGVGTLAWSRHDLVVVANPLPEPATGQIYRCWLDYDGTETAVGRMWFVDGSAFWAASTTDWAPIELDPDKQFLVTLEPASNTGATHVGPIVLQANLGG